MSELELHVFSSECDWVVAENPDDAWAVWCESTGESRLDYEEDFDFALEPDDKVLTIWDEDAGFDHCDCKAKLDAHKADVAKKIAAIEAQPAVARAMLWAAVPKHPRTHPNGHLLECDVGCERKTCGQWAKQSGRGFLCSTEY